jgi:hypothetical protein
MRYTGCNKFDDEEENTEQWLCMEGAAISLLIEFTV